MKLSEYAKKNKISYLTALKRFKQGKIPNSSQDTETKSIWINDGDEIKDDLIALQKARIQQLEETIEKLKKEK